MPDNQEQEFHIPIKQIVKEIPWAARGLAESLLEKLDNVDLNGDHKRDVAQAVKFYFLFKPLADKANKSIDYEKAADWLVEQNFVTDKPLLKAAILEAAGIIERSDD